ncbi:MAG: prenyltransferase [Gammaproteobacteria bacterium]
MTGQRIPLVPTLTAMPRVSPAAWQAASLPVRWLVSARASVLVLTFSSAALGGLIAAGSPQWDLVAWMGCLAGLLLAHAANNQLNDLTDHVRGIDQGNYFRTRYGTHVLEAGLLSRRALAGYFAVTGALAALVGCWLLYRVGSVVLVPFVCGALLLLFYTWPLKQWGCGELAVLLAWGPLMVAGSYAASAGAWRWDVAAIGLCYGLGPTTVIFGKHIDKLQFDRAKGVATLPVRLGTARARQWVRWMLAAQYLGGALLIGVGWLPWEALLAVLAVPRALRLWTAYDRPPPEECPADYPGEVWPLWYSAFAFDHARWFGIWFLGGMALHLALAYLA